MATDAKRHQEQPHDSSISREIPFYMNEKSLNIVYVKPEDVNAALKFLQSRAEGELQIMQPNETCKYTRIAALLQNYCFYVTSKGDAIYDQSWFVGNKITDAAKIIESESVLSIPRDRPSGVSGFTLNVIYVQLKDAPKAMSYLSGWAKGSSQVVIYPDETCKFARIIVLLQNSCFFAANPEINIDTQSWIIGNRIIWTINSN